MIFGADWAEGVVVRAPRREVRSCLGEGSVAILRLMLC